MIVPCDRSVVLCSRYDDVMAAIAVSYCQRGDTGAVVGESSDRRVRGLASGAKSRFRERENSRQGPNMYTGISGAGQNKIGRGVHDE